MRLLQGNPNEDPTLRREIDKLFWQLKKGLEPLQYTLERSDFGEDLTVSYVPIGNSEYFATIPEENITYQKRDGTKEVLSGGTVLSTKDKKALFARAKLIDRLKLQFLSLRGYALHKLDKKVETRKTRFMKDTCVIIHTFSTINHEELIVRPYHVIEETLKKTGTQGRELFHTSKRTTYKASKSRSRHIPIQTQGTIDRITITVELEEQKRFLKATYPKANPDQPINIAFHNGRLSLPQTRTPNFQRPKNNREALELIIQLAEQHDSFVRSPQ